MLTLTNAGWPYQNLPVHFNLHLARGERVAVLGPSGAGKSTLLSLIAGFLPLHGGHIVLNGVDHSTSPPARRPVSILFQEHNLFSHLTVQQNIGLGLHPGLRLTPAQQQELRLLAQQMAIDSMLNHLPGELSGGQRQRVALARCLIRHQPVLLLDEPFNALDPALRQEMLNLLDEVCTGRQLTLLMVSHDIAEAARIAPRSLVIADGQIIEDSSTTALVNGTTPAAALLGITPCQGTED